MDYQVCNFFGENRGSLPSEDTACKFVLVKAENTVWLVFGPFAKYHYHAHLVEGLCNHLGLRSVWVKKPDVVNILDETVEIMGGGILCFDSQKNSVEFSGASRAYGEFNRSELQSLVDKHSLFEKISAKVGT